MGKDMLRFLGEFLHFSASSILLAAVTSLWRAVNRQFCWKELVVKSLWCSFGASLSVVCMLQKFRWDSTVISFHFASSMRWLLLPHCFLSHCDVLSVVFTLLLYGSEAQLGLYRQSLSNYFAQVVQIKFVNCFCSIIAFPQQAQWKDKLAAFGAWSNIFRWNNFV